MSPVDRPDPRHSEAGAIKRDRILKVLDRVVPPMNAAIVAVSIGAGEPFFAGLFAFSFVFDKLGFSNGANPPILSIVARKLPPALVAAIGAAAAAAQIEPMVVGALTFVAVFFHIRNVGQLKT